MLLSLGGAVLLGAVVLLVFPQTNYWFADSADQSLSLLLVLVIVVQSLYGLTFAALTHHALAPLPRARLVGVARLARVKRSTWLYRNVIGRTGPTSEVLQLMIVAALAIILLATRPEAVPVFALLLLTAASIITTWVGSVVSFGIEYLAEDVHGNAFTLPGTSGPDRLWAEYLYGSVLFQASAGSTDMAPLTTGARRLVRSHVILAHVMSTTVIALGVSVVITAVG
jgi:hypothetical protein